MRILIVEDEPEIAELLGAQLYDAGFENDRVGSLGEATNAVRRFPYELVLLDRRLPDGDGLAYIPNIRLLQPEAHRPGDGAGRPKRQGDGIGRRRGRLRHQAL
ncbi:response regulator [Methylosinus sporium]|uniref:response regulator n=1 Tax=Methylosinus sporium TaxID=428 RepID=UPI00383A9B8A